MNPLDLERAAAGELPLESLSDADRARVAALHDEDARLREQLPPPADFAGRVHAAARVHDAARSAAKPRASRAAWALVPAAAAAALFVVVGRDVGPDAGPNAPLEIGRLKGNAPAGAAVADVPAGSPFALHLARRDGDSVTALTDGALARGGDLVQIAFRNDALPSTVIVSLDGRGDVTVHDARRDAARLGQLTALDHAFELDDAPGFERFILVGSADALAVDVVVAAARSAARAADPTRTPLPLPAGVQQTSVVLTKSPRP